MRGCRTKARANNRMFRESQELTIWQIECTCCVTGPNQQVPAGTPRAKAKQMSGNMTRSSGLELGFDFVLILATCVLADNAPGQSHRRTCGLATFCSSSRSAYMGILGAKGSLWVSALMLEPRRAAAQPPARVAHRRPSAGGYGTSSAYSWLTPRDSQTSPRSPAAQAGTLATPQCVSRPSRRCSRATP